MRVGAPVSAEGRTFRRSLGQDLPANAVVTIDVPRVIGGEREKVYLGVAGVVLAAMVVALVVAARRSLPRLRFAAVAAAAPPPERRSRALLREIAALDAGFEQIAAGDEQTRATYDARRTVLKRQLGDALAEERRTS